MTRHIIPEALIVEAMIEIREKSEQAIELETAIKWGARAIAAYESNDLFEGEDFYHEALEHASLVGDHGRTVAQIQAQIDPIRQNAIVRSR